MRPRGAGDGAAGGLKGDDGFVAVAGEGGALRGIEIQTGLIGLNVDRCVGREGVSGLDRHCVAAGALRQRPDDRQRMFVQPDRLVVREHAGRELGGSLGTAWMGKVIADGITTHSSQLGEHVTPYNPIAQAQWIAIARGGMDPPTMLAGRVLREAMVLSFEDGFRITMTAIGLGIVMVFLLKRPAPQGAPSGAH